MKKKKVCFLINLTFEAKTYQNRKANGISIIFWVSERLNMKEEKLIFVWKNKIERANN
jgi:hypothetical protein